MRVHQMHIGILKSPDPLYPLFVFTIMLLGRMVLELHQHSQWSCSKTVTYDAMLLDVILYMMKSSRISYLKVITFMHSN